MNACRAGGVGGDGQHGGGGGVPGGVRPGRLHHLRQLPGEAAGRVRLRLRAQGRRQLRAPLPQDRRYLQLPAARLG